MKIAINGFGRIGRIFFRQIFGQTGFEVVAINDLSDVANLAYLLKYDTVYGRYDKNISTRGNALIVDGQEIKVLAEKEPAKLPWKELNIDVVIEATGIFITRDSASQHLQAGAKQVIITAPAHDKVTPTSTPNLNFEVLTKEAVISNASCTTNAVNPVIDIMMKTVGVKKAILNTLHAYTATQSLVDGIVKGHDFRRGRAAAMNIVPSTTGASEATVRVLPALADKFVGLAIRVPVVCGSLADITFISERPTSVEEINGIFKEAAKKPEWQGIIKVVQEPIVSSDIIGEPYGAIIDLTLTQVAAGDLVAVFSWYDNEWGYCAMLVKQLEALQKLTN